MIIIIMIAIIESFICPTMGKFTVVLSRVSDVIMQLRTNIKECPFSMLENLKRFTV